ncbi:prolyl 4-hydroxylase [Pseudoduganella flava]|uniref:2-oxoglutarate-dependent dioxygenase n=1 Tax=Pseudoduganella flava TaxID=871742 RepID=A0A562PD81_9BURK|nr:2OG-Fe(II) oxygenase [Pseudoduganella flava]QGZ42160.1 2-oxoglutarate-dependent dioxygenase [Pseudoduganella flava]TWI42462.1 prolyl 4-hydroxylase [Pseudoduganella flava]
MNKYTRMSEEWDRWLDASLDKGCRTQDIVAAMVAAHYDPAYAERTVAERQAQRLQPAAAAKPGPYRYGTPTIRHRDNVIETSDRVVRVTMRIEQPVIAVLDDVFAPEECDAVIALARARLQPSATLSPTTGENQVREHRTSEGAFLDDAGDPLLKRLNGRIAEIMNQPVAHGEALHVLHYQVGAEYKPHHDYFDPANPGFAATLKRGGQRVATLIVYLNDVEEAGDTIFPKLGLSIVPKQGRAVYFEYVNGDGQLDEASLHGGAPVARGEKWVATKWVRQGVFR